MNEFFKNNFVIDGHTHIEDWFIGEDKKTFLQTMSDYVEGSLLDYANVLCINLQKNRDVSNNIMALMLKNENTKYFAHGGLMYKDLPVKLPFDAEISPLVQAEDMMKAGFDGIKMIEGKPNYRKDIGISLGDMAFDDYFGYLEEKGIHLLWHTNDPSNLWDRKTLNKYFIERGWYYDRPGYLTYEETYGEIFEVLERHPKLNVTFAHFFFMSEQPERLSETFEKYPNLAIDLTPGNEMYVNIAKKKDIYVDFFKKYGDRIMFGTDNYSDTEKEMYRYKNNMIVDFLLTDDKEIEYYGNTYRGLGLPLNLVKKIMGENFIRRVSDKPKKINPENLLAYIDKYLPYVKNETHRAGIEEYLKKF